ncbi:Uncharacterised protein [Mycobacteroides abscessus]|nr:Uncharacterised protein [Mycobacteroides abscessus]SHY99851.1 Uncharacterised protein [Mycobacteroides abscessus subsp. abscessus]CPZ47735.1 Uncharacterised protein [Mycobacteroides abscessus]CPZ89850.1 Uncharacterised protein [Mycobacteroides abscessus]SIC06037.1 Uncharacterised protein [Mycobacteroides abscessus subsp. abscessus]
MALLVVLAVGADDDVVGADERVEAALVSPCVPHAATENAVRPANASSAPRANRGWASVWVGVIDALRDRRMGQLSVLTAAGVGLRPVAKLLWMSWRAASRDPPDETDAILSGSVVIGVDRYASDFLVSRLQYESERGVIPD